jgi:hypothetical protein
MVRGWQLTVCAIAWPRAYWIVTTYEKNNLKMDRGVGYKLILSVPE